MSFNRDEQLQFSAAAWPQLFTEGQKAEALVHPEFVHPIVNLMCVGAPVAKNHAIHFSARCPLRDAPLNHDAMVVAFGDSHCGWDWRFRRRLVRSGLFTPSFRLLDS
jgi:hypothetical protein